MQHFHSAGVGGAFGRHACVNIVCCSGCSLINHTILKVTVHGKSILLLLLCLVHIYVLCNAMLSDIMGLVVDVRV